MGFAKDIIDLVINDAPGASTDAVGFNQSFVQKDLNISSWVEEMLLFLPACPLKEDCLYYFYISLNINTSYCHVYEIYLKTLNLEEKFWINFITAYF